MSTEDLAKGLLEIAVVGTILRPYFWAKDIVNNLSGGPISFLSRKEVKEICSDPSISKVERGLSDGVIITSKLKYGALSPIKIEVSAKKNHDGKVKLTIHEWFGEPNCLSVLRKKEKRYNFEKLQDMIETKGFVWMAYSIGICINELDEQLIIKTIIEFVNKTALCCLAVSNFKDE